MTITEVLLVGVGGFIGAIIRFLLSKKLNGRNRFPLGTLTVNLVGSFLIGVIFGLVLPKVWTLFLVSGFLGALTTFSTLQKEMIEQWQNRERKKGVIYIVVTYGGGILLAFIGYLFGKYTC